jgi:hypothetical protein
MVGAIGTYLGPSFYIFQIVYLLIFLIFLKYLIHRIAKVNTSYVRLLLGAIVAFILSFVSAMLLVAIIGNNPGNKYAFIALMVIYFSYFLHRFGNSDSKERIPIKLALAASSIFAVIYVLVSLLIYHIVNMVL